MIAKQVKLCKIFRNIPMVSQNVRIRYQRNEIQNYKLFIIYVNRARVRFLFTSTLRNRNINNCLFKSFSIEYTWEWLFETWIVYSINITNHSVLFHHSGWQNISWYKMLIRYHFMYCKHNFKWWLRSNIYFALYQPVNIYLNQHEMVIRTLTNCGNF